MQIKKIYCELNFRTMKNIILIINFPRLDIQIINIKISIYRCIKLYMMYKHTCIIKENIFARIYFYNISCKFRIKWIKK